MFVKNVDLFVFGSMIVLCVVDSLWIQLPYMVSTVNNTYYGPKDRPVFTANTHEFTFGRVFHLNTRIHFHFHVFHM